MTDRKARARRLQNSYICSVPNQSILNAFEMTAYYECSLLLQWNLHFVYC